MKSWTYCLRYARNPNLFLKGWKLFTYYATSKSKMILRRQGGGDDAYYCTYVEEADDAANKDSALI